MQAAIIDTPYQPTQTVIQGRGYTMSHNEAERAVQAHPRQRAPRPESRSEAHKFIYDLAHDMEILDDGMRGHAEYLLQMQMAFAAQSSGGPGILAQLIPTEGLIGEKNCCISLPDMYAKLLANGLPKPVLNYLTHLISELPQAEFRVIQIRCGLAERRGSFEHAMEEFAKWRKATRKAAEEKCACGKNKNK